MSYLVRNLSLWGWIIFFVALAVGVFFGVSVDPALGVGAGIGTFYGIVRIIGDLSTGTERTLVADRQRCPACGKGVKPGASACHHCGGDVPHPGGFVRGIERLTRM